MDKEKIFDGTQHVTILAEDTNEVIASISLAGDAIIKDGYKIVLGYDKEPNFIENGSKIIYQREGV